MPHRPPRRPRARLPSSTSASESASDAPSSASARAAGGRPSRSAIARSSAAARVSATRARSSRPVSIGGGGSRSRPSSDSAASRRKLQALRATAQPVQRGGVALAAAGRLGERLLGASALGEQRLERRLGLPLLRRRSRATAPRPSRSAASSDARSSVAIPARSPAISTPSFSARSAAVAWSASGRRRLATSASTSRARSTCIATRASFSSARWRRRLNFPRPAASSTSVAALLRLRGEDRLDPALRDDRAHRRAEADVGEQLDDVGAADVRAVDEVLALAAAVQAADDRDLGEVELRQRAVLVVEEELDLAVVGLRARVAEPAKRTSSGFSARSSLGASEPAAQISASAMFDLPEPFGPTTTATPGSSRTSTGSGNDLKPRSLIARRCTRRAR